MTFHEAAYEAREKIDDFIENDLTKKVVEICEQTSMRPDIILDVLIQSLRAGSDDIIANAEKK